MVRTGGRNSAKFAAGDDDDFDVAKIDRQGGLVDDQARKVKTDSYSRILENNLASIEQKADAAARLFEQLPRDSSGRAPVVLNDAGVKRDYQIDMRTLGQASHVGAIFTRDAQGVEHPVLRWVERNGHIERQCDRSGQYVDFRSTYAVSNMRDSNVAQIRLDGDSNE